MAVHDSARPLPSSATPAAALAVQGRLFGAFPEHGGVRFRVFAPAARELLLHVQTGAAAGTHRPASTDGGICEFFVSRAVSGDLYHYTLDGSDPRPDPASRFQPQGVHGPSQVVDPAAFRWGQQEWRGRPARELVVYELHVGTFTEGGTFASARERLGELVDLGVTAVELMPVADFAGTRNWGYDGVCLYAPSRNYGTPDDLRAFVDAAHAAGLAVILDVVYNHLGPEGAYHTQFHPGYITERHHTPWGGAVNLDGPGSPLVRSFIIDNAVQWIRDYRLDGLRLDATHALIDESPTHIVAELVDRVRAAAPWPVALHAEDHRNLTSLVEPRESGGWGLDGVWADDFHHIVRRMLAGDAHGYYEDFTGTTEELAQTVRQGWLFTGQLSKHMQEHRGTDASRVPMGRFVVCLQNHDQVGNRATGDRLHHQIDEASWRAASTLLLVVPMTPLLFMGQEWAASTPFQFFTDLEPDLGRKVTEGRRKEFKAFPEFADPAGRERIPDPQAASTFENSRLRWAERETGVHAATLALYRELLRLRRSHPALGASADVEGIATAADPGAVVLERAEGGERFVIFIRLSGEGPLRVEMPGGATPEVIFSTEDPRFTPVPAAPQVDPQSGWLAVRFARPGAIIVQVR